MRFLSLASGSRGNAILVESAGARVLLDCGLTLRELERRLSLRGVDAATLDALLITHEHQDHLRGAGALARRHRIPIWTTAGTWRQGGGRIGELPELHLINPHQGCFRIADLRITPFAIPHDAGEPVQFVFETAGKRLGVLTDSGAETPHIRESLAACDGLFLECNHCPEMLATGPYPPRLQRRVGGGYGHLSNPQAATLLSRLDHARLQYLVAGHLSEKNNTPALARQSLLAVSLRLEAVLSLATQYEPTEWHEF